MTRHENVFVTRFQAQDPLGRSYTIEVFQQYLVSTDLDGVTSRIPGLRSFRTSDGKSVNWLERGRYQIFTPEHTGGLDLESTDPNAV